MDINCGVKAGTTCHMTVLVVMRNNSRWVLLCAFCRFAIYCRIAVYLRSVPKRGKSVRGLRGIVEGVRCVSFGTAFPIVFFYLRTYSQGAFRVVGVYRRFVFCVQVLASTLCRDGLFIVFRGAMVREGASSFKLFFFYRYIRRYKANLIDLRVWDSYGSCRWPASRGLSARGAVSCLLFITFKFILMGA